jgi:anti-anti-sigma factor
MAEQEIAMEAYTIERSGEDCRVTLQGDLTAPIVPDLQAALRRELEHPARKVVFDLARTVMLDSIGIGLLIAVCNSVQGKVHVENVSRDILQLFQRMRLVSRLNAGGPRSEEHHG